MINKKIAIIGAGHMGQALALGLLLDKKIAGENLILANPHLDKLTQYKEKYKIHLTTDNIEAAKYGNILIIAVKPRIVEKAVKEIKKYIRKDALIISVAACIPIRLLVKYIGSNDYKIIRIMPNLPVSEGRGIIGWLPGQNITSKERKIIQKLLSPLGTLIECRDDDQMDKLSMISGCGPGYVGYFMRSLQEKAMKYGFSESDAYRMVLSTFFGTVHNLETKNITFQDLVMSIATRGGITEEVLKNLDDKRFPQIFGKCIDCGYDKIKNIEKELEGMK